MKKFTTLIENTFRSLYEQDAPPPPPPEGGAGGMDAGGGEMPIGGDMGGMGGEEPQQEPEEMENAVKRNIDPIAYTENFLEQMVNPDEGITPEMFNDFIDTFGVGLAKIRDKESFKKFYADTYRELKEVMRARDKLKSMFEQLHSTLQDVLTTQTRDPNNAGGGEGTKGPSGPGVQ